MRYNYDNAESFMLPDSILRDLKNAVGSPINSAALLASLSSLADCWGSHGFSLSLEGNIHLSVNLYWYRENEYQILFKIGSSAAGFGAEGRDLFRITGQKEAICRLWQNVVTPPRKMLARKAKAA
jgi:hypothetical protein